MKKNFIKLSVIIFSFAVVSCSKEATSPSGGADITGNYKFISLQAKTTTTAQTSSSAGNFRVVSTSDYTTQKNSGSVTISASKFTSNNLAYSVNTIANITLYNQGVVETTYPTPFQLDVPASSGSASYKRVNADSIYFESGSIVMADNTMSSQPSGARIKVENGNLVLTSNVLQTSTTRSQNETITQTAQATTVITLQKQ
jgi:hypothetical protein